MNKYEFYSTILQEDFPVKYREVIADNDSEQRKEIRELLEVLARVDAYLSGHSENAICNGSKLHMEIKDILAAPPAAAEPIGWVRLEPDDNETASYHFYRQPVEGSTSVCFVTAPVAAGKSIIEVPTRWMPIEQAPLDNKRPLYIAQFNETGELIELDWDAVWEAESESWEMPQVYYIWKSANGRVEEPTHFAYMDAPPAVAHGDEKS